MKKLILFACLFISLSSCERLIMPKPVSKSPTEVFEHLWKTIDEGYVYFKYRGIDWDTIHTEFQAKIYDTMPPEALFDTCAVMLARLQDPYVSLKSSFREYSYIDTAEFNYLPNFNRKNLEKYYWKNYKKIGPFIHTIIDSVGYVYYGSFKDEVKEEHLNMIIEPLRLKNDSIHGMVFDIRNNEGGDMRNAFELLKRMGVDTSYTISAVLYKAFYKSSKEKDDFTEAQTAYIEQNDKVKFPRQFVVLTNRSTKAEAALFATGAKGYQNVRVYGDTTGGGAGRIVGAELPNGWQFTYPASYFTTDDDRNIEDGVAPHQRVDITPADEAKGVDAILDAALQALKDL